MKKSGNPKGYIELIFICLVPICVSIYTSVSVNQTFNTLNIPVR